MVLNPPAFLLVGPPTGHLPQKAAPSYAGRLPPAAGSLQHQLPGVNAMRLCWGGGSGSVVGCTTQGKSFGARSPKPCLVSKKTLHERLLLTTAMALARLAGNAIVNDPGSEAFAVQGSGFRVQDLGFRVYRGWHLSSLRGHVTQSTFLGHTVRKQEHFVANIDD